MKIRTAWTTQLLSLTLSCLILGGSDLAAQPRHRILTRKNRFYLEDLNSRQIREFDMWSTRLANALFDSRFTDRVVANLDDYLRFGVNTLSVSIQGGNLGSTSFNTRYPAVYNKDGTLELGSPVWSNLKRVLAETDRRGMVLIIQYWYFKRDENVPTESAALAVTRRVTAWLKATGHRNYILDLVNEFGHKEYGSRTLFSTVNGALALLNAVYETDAEALAGMSPQGRLFSPEGYLTVGSVRRWVEARITYSHNQPADPQNPSSYYLHGLPKDPLGKPYVNNEFNSQLGYERYPRPDPRTRLHTYGHWDRKTVDLYIADMKKVRAYGGYANVFSHRQQYLTREADLPVAEIGPAGTQPESTPGGGEGSMHWCFAAIAEIRKLAPPGRRHDFNLGRTYGLETELVGKWRHVQGELRQEDPGLKLAWARLSARDGDVDVAFDAGFLADPGSNGRFGIQLGAATPDGPAYRLLVAKDTLTFDQIGASIPPKRIPFVRAPRDRFRLTLRDKRVRLTLNGRTIVDREDISPVPAENLLLVTREATAAFDNLRVGPIVSVTFDDGLTGEWTPDDPKAWSVIDGPLNPGDRVWQAVAGTNAMRHASLDRGIEDFDFTFEANLTTAVFTALRFRAADVAKPLHTGYLLRVIRDGTVALDRLEGTAPPRSLGTTWARIDPSAVRVRVVACGPRLRVFVDGRCVVDATDPGLPLERGGLVLLAQGGTARFDDLELKTGPSLFPDGSIEPALHRSSGAGLGLTVTDPDGFLDLADVRLLIDRNDSRGFEDATYLLSPSLGLFAIRPTVNGKGRTARLLHAIPFHGARWTLLLLATDLSGNTTGVFRRLY
jgi:hypothetical protein